MQDRKRLSVVVVVVISVGVLLQYIIRELRFFFLLVVYVIRPHAHGEGDLWSLPQASPSKTRGVEMLKQPTQGTVPRETGGVSPV